MAPKNENFVFVDLFLLFVFVNADRFEVIVFVLINMIYRYKFEGGFILVKFSPINFGEATLPNQFDKFKWKPETFFIYLQIVVTIGAGAVKF